MNFTKMQAIGNDFIVTSYDEIKKYLNNINEIAIKLCHRRFGIGADGLIFFSKSDIADIKMNYYNSDGTRAKMCGNGIRCLSKYVYDNNIVDKKDLIIETDDGLKYINIENDLVSVNLGEADFNPKTIPCLLDGDEIINQVIHTTDKSFVFSMVRVGVPHVVIVVQDMLEDEEVNKYGAYLENHKLFPDRANINFVQVKSRDEVIIKSFERAAGRTLGCGTGCSSSAVILNKLNLTDKKIKFHADGGELIINLVDNNIIMQGKAETVFKGNIII